MRQREPGLFMVEAEWFAFRTVDACRILSLLATELAAQSVVMTVCVVMAHIPFFLSLLRFLPGLGTLKKI
jgi:hypothetical protein